MKKLLPLLLILMIGFSGYAQDVAKKKVTKDDAMKQMVHQVLPAKAPALDAINFWQATNPYVKSPSRDVSESTIGTTWYDMQTNTSLSNRLYLHPDGTMGGVWTMAGTAAFTLRGTGYNYFDGNDWGQSPENRLEDNRCGWPSYAPWGPNGEIVVSHWAGANPPKDGLAISIRENKGSTTEDWIQSDYFGSLGGDVDPTWPRVATSGENNEYIHIFYNSYNVIGGFGNRMYYTRSSDGGATWDPEDEILEGTGDDYYFDMGGDDQTLAVRGNTVVMMYSSKWEDCFIMKSTDNGDNWEKTVVWEHPYPFFDFDVTETDQIWAADGGSVAIGPDGKVHVVFGVALIANETPGDGNYDVWKGPYVDGIVYWNEDMPTFGNDTATLAPPFYEEPASEMVPDYNFIGWTQDMDGNGTIDMDFDKIITYRTPGLSCWPSIVCDDDGLIFVTYSSTNEEFSNFDYYYKKIWARAYVDEVWGPFVHITAPFTHIFDESIYPSLSPTSDANIYMLYQNDSEPGSNLNEDHDALLNSMIVTTIPKTDFLGVGIDESQLISSESVTQNYPNPFSDFSTISVYLEQGANLSLEVTNLIGQKVFAQDRGSVSNGTYHFTVDARSFEPGIYFYTVRAGNSTVTKKMIVK